GVERDHVQAGCAGAAVVGLGDGQVALAAVDLDRAHRDVDADAELEGAAIVGRRVLPEDVRIGRVGDVERVHRGRVAGAAGGAAADLEGEHGLPRLDPVAGEVAEHVGD